MKKWKIFAFNSINSDFLCIFAAKQMVGRDQATFPKLATNSTQPSLDMLIKIAKVLEVELTDLVRIPKDG